MINYIYIFLDFVLCCSVLHFIQYCWMFLIFSFVACLILLSLLFGFIPWHCMVYAWSLQLRLHDTQSNPTRLLNDECGPLGSLHSTLTSALTFFFIYFFRSVRHRQVLYFVFFRFLRFSIFLLSFCQHPHQVKFSLFWAVECRNELAHCGMSLF